MNVSPTMFTGLKSFDKREYICKTCNSKLSKPCQAMYNNMIGDTVPTELECFEKLEQVLIAQKIVFERVVIMPKGQQRKIKGTICNVLLECDVKFVSNFTASPRTISYYYVKTKT